MNFSEIMSYICSICDTTFKQSSHLKDHYRIHSGEKPYVCPICSKSFTQSSSMNRHIKQAHNVVGSSSKKDLKPGCLYAQNFLLEDNADRERKVEKDVCDICFEKVTKNELRKHKKIHKDESFMCEICNKMFSSKYSKLLHVKTVHTNNKPFKCECNAQFSQISSYRRHKRQVHGDTLYYNELIGKTLQNSSSILYNDCNRTASKNVLENNNLICVCDLCAKVFPSEIELRSHILKHMSYRPFSCEKCLKTFKTNTALQVHIKIHNDNKQWNCSKCSSNFKNKHTLNAHLKSHDTKKYKCQNCSLSYSELSELKSHLSTHTEKLYLCCTCNARFSKVQALRNHELIHTSEKNFKCNICGKLFRLEVALKKHHISHIEYSFKCDICDNVFRKFGHLKNHKRVHENKCKLKNEDALSDLPINDDNPTFSPFIKFHNAEDINLGNEDLLHEEQKFLPEITTSNIKSDETVLAAFRASENDCLVDNINSINSSPLSSKQEIDNTISLNTDQSQKTLQLNGYVIYIPVLDDKLSKSNVNLLLDKLTIPVNSVIDDNINNLQSNMYNPEVEWIEKNDCGPGDNHSNETTVVLSGENSFIGLPKVNQASDSITHSDPLSVLYAEQDMLSSSVADNTLGLPKENQIVNLDWFVVSAENSDIPLILSEKMETHSNVENIFYNSDHSSCLSNVVNCNRREKHRKSEKKSYLCSVCSEEYVSLKSYKIHMRTHADERPYKCKECDAKFKQIGHLKCHVLIHQNIKQFSCEMCNKSFIQKSTLNRHFKLAHRVEQLSLKHSKITTLSCTNFYCKYCEKSIVGEYKKLHTQKHMQDLMFQCELCGKCFKLENKLRKHLSQHIVENNSNVEIVTKCNICSKECNSASKLKIHMNVHNNKLFNCEKCEKKFTRTSELMEHMSSHTGLKNFSCSVCWKSFVKYFVAYKHIKYIHKGNGRVIKLPSDDYSAISIVDLTNTHKEEKFKVKEHEKLDPLLLSVDEEELEKLQLFRSDNFKSKVEVFETDYQRRFKISSFESVKPPPLVVSSVSDTSKSNIKFCGKNK